MDESNSKKAKEVYGLDVVRKNRHNILKDLRGKK